MVDNEDDNRAFPLSRVLIRDCFSFSFFLFFSLSITLSYYSVFDYDSVEKPTIAFILTECLLNLICVCVCVSVVNVFLVNLVVFFLLPSCYFLRRVVENKDRKAGEVLLKNGVIFILRNILLFLERER